MTHTALVARETTISVAINAMLSFLFFIAVFGLATPVAAPAFARDFLPQAFMVALMGSLVPGLLMRRHGRDSVRAVVRRAVLLALAGVVVAGGGGFLTARSLGDATIATAVALPLKITFGAVLAAIVTPLAVRATLSSGRRA